MLFEFVANVYQTAIFIYLNEAILCPLFYKNFCKRQRDVFPSNKIDQNIIAVIGIKT